jgi:Zn2+/Cd2+-exporting ATPase
MEKQIYFIEGMDCIDCALNIEKGVRKLDRVKDVHIDFTTGWLQIEGEATPDTIRQRVEALGYRVLDAGAAHSNNNHRSFTNPIAGFWRFLLSRPETRLALIGGLLLVLGFAAGFAGINLFAVRMVQIVALGIAGYPIARSGISNLVINREFNISLLMTIAAIGAIIIGEIAEGATLIFLFAIAEALEGYTTDRARNVLAEMRQLAPSTAIRIGASGDTVVPVEDLIIGDRILVRPGDRIPMDGVILSGMTEVDQSAITGESMPVIKDTGSDVFAATINGSGEIVVKVTRLVKDTTLSRIIQRVAEAQSLRAPTQRFIDRFARIYTPLMVIVALLVATIPPLLFGQPFLNTAAGDRGWLYRSLALLVIACPCALVISAPVTILSAITQAARRGILIKGGVYLEALAAVRVFAFDKTGTLTQGEPAVTLVRSIDCETGELCEHCNDVLGLAYSLEQRSGHPLAHAIVSAAEAQGMTGIYGPADDVQALPGRGVQGWVGGKLATIGSHHYFHTSHPHDVLLCDWAAVAELEGQTAMLVSDGDRVRGVIAVADQIRPHSHEVVRRLHKLDLKSVMLTGDNATVAHAVAASVGIGIVRAGLMPEDKLTAVEELDKKYGRVAMVGDGINDTPALAAASVGISMGGAASDQALEAADIVLMADDLMQLPFAVQLSRFARRLIHANVAISLLTKLIFVVLALSGITSMWLAVLADMGVSLLVTLNGMRALRYNPRRG